VNNFFRRHAYGLLVVLAGCTTIPATSIQQPISARPIPQSMPIAHNGAIFQSGKSNALFEDRRARSVGDTLTINIVEVTAASQSSSKSATHAGSITATTPTITSGTGKTLLSPLGITHNTAGSLADKSAGAGTNTFSGTITVTVIEVLGNGNLLVGGEKQVAIDRSSEYIRFSGVINPNTITGSNTVLSTQVADVHVEYKGATHIDQSTFTSMLGRVFLSVLPF
jgi:flagellar L-ring protein precursor FlgH